MAVCSFHEDKKAVASCKKCGKDVCQDCLRELKGDSLCKVCVIKLYMTGCSIVKYEP